jgi:Skp family chaperone for outer membrane proteins
MRPAALRRVIALTLCATMAAGLAQGVNIVTVDMQLVFDGYYKTKRFEKAIVADADMVYLDTLEKNRQTLDERLQTLVARAQSPALSDEAKKDNREEGMKVSLEIRDKERDIANVKRKLERRKQDERDAILGEIQTVINQYCKDNAVDLLIDTSGRTLNGIPTVVYANPAQSITDKVLVLINAGHEDELKALAAELAPAPTPAPEPAP